MITSARIVSSMRGFYVHMPCDVLELIGSNVTRYPQRAAGGIETAVEANMETPMGPEDATAAFLLVFGQAGLIAFTIHAVLVEVYFHLTPAESERLRNVAYQRQLARGYKMPGSGGLTSDRLGDAPRWKPSSVVDTK